MIVRRMMMATLPAAAGAIAAGLLLATAAAQPPPKKFGAALNIGQETGTVKSPQRGASGRFTAALRVTTFVYELTFSHLSGSATAAHIHGPAGRGVSAPVLVPLCGPCTSPVTGRVTLTPSQIRLLQTGKTYVNVHTAKNPNGEIRGQISLAH